METQKKEKPINKTIQEIENDYEKVRKYLYELEKISLSENTPDTNVWTNLNKLKSQIKEMQDENDSFKKEICKTWTDPEYCHEIKYPLSKYYESENQDE